MKKKPMSILKEYFGTQTEYKGLAGLRGFMAEVKELSKDDKDELVDLAAAELGVEVDRG